MTSTPFESSETATGTGHPRRWWILMILCLALMVLVVDNTVLNLAIPSLMRDLDATPADIQWVIDAYILAFAGLLLTAGSLSDRFGRRKMLLLGLVVFGLASMLATLAENPWQLIACRGLMGVGGSLLMPSTLSLLFTVFPPAEHRKAMAAWSMVAMVGVVAGPTVGGVLLNHFWWGSIFLMNVPIAILAIVGTLALIPESKGPARNIDAVGAILTMVGMASIVWAIVSIPLHGWGSGRVIGMLVLGVVSLTAFALWEKRSAHPMVPLALFKDRRFSGTSFSIVLLSFTAGGLMLALTQYLQFALQYSPLKAGLALLPYAVAAALFNGLGATLGKKVADRTLISLGLLIIAGSFLILAQVSDTTGYGLLILGLLVMGVGAGLAGPAAYTLLMQAVPAEHRGVGSAMNDTVQQTGAALSVAVLGSVLAASYSSKLPDVVPEPARKSIADTLALGPDFFEAAKHAFVDAMSIAMMVGAAGALAGAVVAVVVLPRGARKSEEEPVPTVNDPVH
ncbi:MFS transporter [Kribbella solani]|uniref:EmrB/QacA subfamily drug resistance transporter n=1 Tax=Kribbella solani TaxID=236067 RepID=A0A841E6J7_9ACTN|nr:MFS transporter [Kribbella solani]MBB5983947.1 EmrB/QacA subfamily drug resistance transporter [Kribbella solani]MDX2973259.1 MFS transporter [Kribbella solani]